jgi:hypothetical protein
MGLANMTGRQVNHAPSLDAIFTEIEERKTALTHRQVDRS